MAEIKTFESPPDFFEFNYEILHSNYFKYFHVHRLHEELLEGRELLYDAFNITDIDGSFIMILVLDRLIYIYAEKWNENTFDLLKNRLAQIVIKTTILRGDKSIILKFIITLNIDYEIINDRNIYEIVSLNQLFKQEKGKFGKSNSPDQATIQKLSADYYNEEFEGKGQQAIESVKRSASQGILNESIFKWSNGGRIVSMARILNDDQSNAMIGGLFTKPMERKKGFAYFLIWHLTEYLFKAGYLKCGLLTEANKISTNKIFEQVGYKKIYGWVNILIK
jgi:Acetyltransferase (GNAT) family